MLRFRSCSLSGKYVVSPTWQWPGVDLITAKQQCNFCLFCSSCLPRHRDMVPGQSSVLAFPHQNLHSLLPPAHYPPGSPAVAVRLHQLWGQPPGQGRTAGSSSSVFCISIDWKNIFPTFDKQSVGSGGPPWWATEGAMSLSPIAC